MVAAGLFLPAAHPGLCLQLPGTGSCTNPRWCAVGRERSDSSGTGLAIPAVGSCSNESVSD